MDKTFTGEDFLDMYKVTNNYTQAIAKIKNVIDDDRWVIIDYDIYFRGQMEDILCVLNDYVDNATIDKMKSAFKDYSPYQRLPVRVKFDKTKMLDRYSKRSEYFSDCEVTGSYEDTTLYLWIDKTDSDLLSERTDLDAVVKSILKDFDSKDISSFIHTFKIYYSSDNENTSISQLLGPNSEPMIKFASPFFSV